MELIPARHDVAEKHALVFESHDDASRFFKHRVEDGNCRYRVCDLLLLEGYKNIDLSLVLKLNAPFGAGVFDLVFRAVPTEFFRKCDITGGPTGGGSSDFEIERYPNHKRNQRVFAQVTEFVEGVERPIPSFVTIERSKKRLDFRRQVLASTPNALIEIGSGFAERKGSVSGIRVALSGQMSGEGGMIETGPHMLDDLGSEDAPPKWESLSELKFVDFVNAVRIRLANNGVWLFSEKLVNLRFEVIKMFLCAQESHLRAVENAEVTEFHSGQIRSNESS